MSLSDLVTADAANIILNTDELAANSNYKFAASGNTSSLPIVWERDVQVRTEVDAHLSVKVRHCWVSKASVPSPKTDYESAAGVAHDEVRPPGESSNWYVRKIVDDNGALWRLQVADQLTPYID